MTRTQYRTKYLRSPHWQRFRREAAKSLERVCPCGARSNLDLHHMTYERLGHERLSDVAWLCRSCHDALHRDDPAGGLFDPSRAKPSIPGEVKRLEGDELAAHNLKIKQSIKQRAKRRAANPVPEYTEAEKARRKKYGGYLARR